MGKLIEFDDLKTIYQERIKFLFGTNEPALAGAVAGCLDIAESKVPAVDAEPVVHAHWEESVSGAYCSECGCELERIIRLRARSILKDFDVPDEECYNYVDITKPYPCYCPNCGAKMGKEEKNG